MEKLSLPVGQRMLRFPGARRGISSLGFFFFFGCFGWVSLRICSLLPTLFILLCNSVYSLPQLLCAWGEVLEVNVPMIRKAWCRRACHVCCLVTVLISSVDVRAVLSQFQDAMPGCCCNSLNTSKLICRTPLWRIFLNSFCYFGFNRKNGSFDSGHFRLTRLSSISVLGQVGFSLGWFRVS